jgi:type IV pilus assembly protein PilC
MQVLQQRTPRFPHAAYGTGRARVLRFHYKQMKFLVTIQASGGRLETRTMEAPSRFAVYEAVQKEGGVVSELKEESGFRIPAWLTVTIGTGVKRAEIIRTAKNLSAMITAGLSLSRALTVIERQSSNKRLKAIMADIGESIKKGSSFHAALGAYPKIFSPLFIAMVRAGEESGGLSDALTVVALQMDRAEQLTRKIKGAMIYPSIVIFAVVVIGILMMVFVVPTLTKTFTSLGAQVPLATRVIVALSNFMAAHVFIVFGALLAFIAGGIVFVRSTRGSAIVLWVGLHAPVLRELIQETYAARCARTLSSLLASGVPVLEALSITEDVIHARAFADVVKEAAVRVKKGDMLSAAFSEHTRIYPVLMSDMLAVGEETGKVSEMLHQIADFYEEDVSEKTKDLSTIIEPVLMLFIGTVVGIFAVAMIAPIYQLSSAIS